jgi:hypothetical protein
MPTRRVFVSLPADTWLDDDQNALKWAIVERVGALDVVTEIFVDPRGTPSLAGPYGWSAERADDVIRRCSGAVLIGMPRWTFGDANQRVELTSEFCHYEGAVARTLLLPTLVLVLDGVLRRVVFDASFGGYVGTIPREAGLAWLDSREFLTPFAYWRRQLEERRDVFLGYCSSSRKVAKYVKRWLNRHDVTVLDWRTDFLPGRNILQQIEHAAERCGSGIFLFTKDDDFVGPTSGSHAAPRDNVVFEAGYFIKAKGKDRVLILREADARMPADLGGDIYVPFEDRADIDSITDALRLFVDAI